MSIVRVSGLFAESDVIQSYEDQCSDWTQFGKGSDLKYRVCNSSSSGIYFTFPSRDWTLDMSINIGDSKTIRCFGVRSGTLIKDLDIPVREEGSPLYSVSLSIHIGNGIVKKESFKLRSISGLDFWFMKEK
jgi:hypothetical protein